MKKKLALVLGVGIVSLAAASPAAAINDGRVPAGTCAASPSAVGTPGGEPNPGLDNTGDRVGPPASANNPGNSTGALGEENSQAPCSS